LEYLMVLPSVERVVEEADSLPLRAQSYRHPAVLQALSLLSGHMK
jgi:hypothetical protein